MAIVMLLTATTASAQTQQLVFTSKGGKANTQILMNSDQKLMLEAAQKVMKKEYPAAETLYSQAILANGGNIDAYLQRAMVRRELNNPAGVQQDARMAVVLANNALQKNNRNATLFYQRGMGFRLLKDFAQARQDIAGAIRMGGGSASWQSDLDGITMEEKAAQ